MNKLEQFEDEVIYRYGFENWRTVLVFKVTDFIRKIFKLFSWNLLTKSQKCDIITTVKKREVKQND